MATTNCERDHHQSTGNSCTNGSAGENWTGVSDGPESGIFSEFHRAITLSVMCGFSGATNLLAFYLLTCGYRRSRKRLSILWAPLINLCVADFVITAFGMGGSAAWLFTDRWLAGDFMCRLVKYVQVLGNNASTYIVMFISVDRAYAVSRPMTSMSSARWRIRCLLISAWLIAALGSMPQWFIFSVVEAPPPYEPGFYQCYSLLLDENIELSVYYSLIICAFSFIIPFIVMIVAYTIILVVIRKKSRLDPSNQCEADSRERPPSCAETARPDETSSLGDCSRSPQRLDLIDQPGDSQSARIRRQCSRKYFRFIFANKSTRFRQASRSRRKRFEEVDALGSSEASEALVKKRNAEAQCNDNRNMLFKRAMHKSLKTFLIIITSFLICWIPYYSFFLVYTIRNYVRYLNMLKHAAEPVVNSSDTLEETVANWTSLFAMLSPLINPLIYGSFQFKFVTGLRRLLTRTKSTNAAYLPSRTVMSMTVQ